MPSILPLVASGSREMKRPRPVPRLVRDAVRLMVFGAPDDPDGAPIDFVQAAHCVGLRPFVLRRFFDRAEVRALLRSERAAFRQMINAGNELSLKSIRDTAQNSMARIAAVRRLEDLDAADIIQSRAQGQTPGVVIVISSPRENTASEPAVPVTIDARPMPAIEDGPRRDSAGNPVFSPTRDGRIDRD
jgi:hypothetical protein